MIPQPTSRSLRQLYFELLVWAGYLRQGRVDAGRAGLLRDWASEHLRGARSLLASAGVIVNGSQLRAEDQAFLDAEQVAVCVLDEAALQVFKGAWPPLQQELYGHQSLGKHLFERLERLRTSPIDPNLPNEVLEVYLQALVLGYESSYAVKNQRDDLEQLARKLARVLGERLGPAPPLGNLPPLPAQRNSAALLSPMWILCIAMLLLTSVGMTASLRLTGRESDARTSVDSWSVRVRCLVDETQPACQKLSR